MTRLPSLAGRIDAVVIGASAGGVEALCALLPSVPVRLEAPILVVLHLPRHRPSLLAEIFSVKSRRPVREPVDKEPIEPGVIYVAPPDYHMLVDHMLMDESPQIALSTDELVNYSRPSIDVLFDSAADFYGERLLGIILTGANEDGAEGLAAIHAAGGLTAVQEPEDAQAPFMLVSALKRVPADYVLPLEGIARLLEALESPEGG